MKRVPQVELETAFWVKKTVNWGSGPAREISPAEFKGCTMLVSVETNRVSQIQAQPSPSEPGPFMKQHQGQPLRPTSPHLLTSTRNKP